MNTMSEMIELPKAPIKASKTVPGNLIIFGLPKCGKTTALSQLPNCLIIDVERGSDFVDSMRIQPPKDLGPVGIYNWFKDVAKAVKEEGRPYDFVAIDTISALDELSEWVGTWNYMHSQQGKNFNRKNGAMMTPDDSDYQSVHTLPDGNGYRYSRAVMTELFDICKDLGKICTIFVSHVADKFVVSKMTNTEVRSMDLSLTGKVRNIYSRDVDAVGYVWNKDGKVNISFKGDENKLGGMRGNEHIQGYEGELDWNKIFQLKVA